MHAFPSAISLAFIALFFVCPAQALKLGQGTFTLGGHMTVPFKYSADGRQQIALHEEPQVSYFVADNVRLVASFEIDALLRWSSDYPLTPGVNTWGGKLGAEYVFSLNSSLFLSSGLRLGVRAQNALFDYAQGLVEVPISLWWAINENAALEVAFSGEFAISRQFGFESISMAPGYFGVIGFF